MIDSFNWKELDGKSMRIKVVIVTPEDSEVAARYMHVFGITNSTKYLLFTEELLDDQVY